MWRRDGHSAGRPRVLQRHARQDAAGDHHLVQTSPAPASSVTRLPSSYIFVSIYFIHTIYSVV